MSNLKHSNFNTDVRVQAMAENALAGGVRVDPVPLTPGQEVTVFYSGLLSNAGADQVYLHFGYGDAKHWRQTEDMRMEKLDYGWAKKMMINGYEQFNFCFRDSANNWDNNNGYNWSFQVHDGEEYR